MRGAAMSGFVVFLLSVSVMQSQSNQGVAYPSAQICALKGSSVNLHCSSRSSRSIPSTGSGGDAAADRAFWFTRMKDGEPVDLRTDPEYAGRVQLYNNCTLRISDLRESDSAEYRISTNHLDGRLPGKPGVTLSVTEFQVQMKIWKSCYKDCIWVDLTCRSSCRPTSQSSYIWYENGMEMKEKDEYFYTYIYPKSHYSCALKGFEGFPSPSVCVHDESCHTVTYADRRICAFKGSSVDISCTYNNIGRLTSKFWFSPDRSRHWRYLREPEDLRKDFRYAGRVQVVESERGRSTLTISDLRETDSAQYRFRLLSPSFEWRNTLPGTTLTVTDPDLQVQVIWSSSGPKLVCHSSCLGGRSSFVWYKNETKIQGETSPLYGGYVNSADRYFCAYQDFRSTPVYAPKVSIAMNSSGDIMEGASLSLTCSSDANPVAKNTWYKKKQTVLLKGAQLVFSSIQSSDSGEYYCTAENELGKTSQDVSVNVRYAPKLPSVSLSPSGQIVEGSSVTLSCSSDANPAANYTWYKENQTVLQGPEGVHHFTSINSEDRGIYCCKSENQYGRISSASLFLDVQYPPKLPSVSLSPSGQIVEGSSVNLSCSSDANPAANYTWYKEREEAPKASGQMFTISDVTPGHSGSYYCEAQNSRGRSSSALYLIALPGSWKSAAAGITTAALLAVTLLAAFLWMRSRRNKSFTQESKGGERSDSRAQVGPVSDVSTADQQEDLLYSNICFTQHHEDVLYSNIRPTPNHRGRTEEDQENGVEYTAVKPASCVQRLQEDVDSFALYSTVNK